MFAEKEQRSIVLFKGQMNGSLFDEGIFGLCLTFPNCRLYRKQGWEITLIQYLCAMDIVAFLMLPHLIHISKKNEFRMTFTDSTFSNIFSNPHNMRKEFVSPC